MSLLDFEAKKPRRKGQKNQKIGLLALAIIPAALILKSTIAGNISINTGAAVTFGQGVATTVACDPEIILTPTSSFKTVDGTGSFKFASLTVSDVSSNCYGTDFIIQALKNGAGAPLKLVNSDGTLYNELRINDNNGVFTPVGDSLAAANVITNSSSSFTINFDSQDAPQIWSVANSADVDRITIENTHGSSAIAGSLAFTQNWIDFQPNNEFILGTQDFTIEVWANVDSSMEKGSLYDTGGNVNAPGGFAFWFENDGETKKLKYRMGGISGEGIPDIAVTMNPAWYGSWHHYAVTRTSGIMRMYVDGVLVASSWDTVNNIHNGTQISLTDNAPVIGALANFKSSYHLTGMIHSLRVIKGTALYVEPNFTPPANLTNISNTLLLLTPLSDGTIIDQSAHHWLISNSSVLPIWVPDQPTNI